jgi:hypothetical protein
VFGVAILVLLEMIALGAAPAPDRPVVAGALIGAVAAALVVGLALLSTCRPAAGNPCPRLEETGLAWPAGVAVDGFPMDAVRSLLLSPGAPSLSRLYVAWGFAMRGCDAAWLERFLDLPADAARLLADTAYQRD